jgi:hypothetical protein
MSCTLLEKLAAETRLRIYEYVLTFDTPVKHANKMRPFVEKLTGARGVSGPKQMQSTILKELTKAGSKFGVKAKAVQGSEPSDVDGSLQRIDTSILTTCKLVYNEAISVFYTSNTIHFEAQLCRRKDITHSRATDLSLATQMVIKIDQPLFLTHIRPDDFWDFALLMLPKTLAELAHRDNICSHRLSTTPHRRVANSAWHIVAQSNLLRRRWLDGRDLLWRRALRQIDHEIQACNAALEEPCREHSGWSGDYAQRCCKLALPEYTSWLDGFAE